MTVWLWLILLRNLASLKELSVGGSPPRTGMETVKKTRRAFAKDKASVRKRGGQPGNKNSKGKQNAKGHGAPKGTQNALKHGGYSAVYWDTLDEDERELIESMPQDEEEILINQIALYTVRGTPAYESNQ